MTKNPVTLILRIIDRGPQVHDPSFQPPEDRDKWQLSDWTVRLALVTILVLGLFVSLSTGSLDAEYWDLADRSAVQTKATGE
ncbi:hypothetical protein [Actibacterium pelagium]|uniref:hypothetical protein n=1 Tax=Actibacterium pelagium TaxID=2029103 RepID=UPI0011779E07|nr:hypothetical protein [Actibacterium pelagium]